MIANQYVRDDPSDTNAPVRTIITLDNGGNWELVSFEIAMIQILSVFHS